MAGLDKVWGSSALGLATLVYHLLVSYPMQLLAIPVSSVLPRAVPLPFGARLPSPHFLQLVAMSLIVPLALCVRSARGVEAAATVAVFHYFNQFDTAVYRRMISTGRISVRDCPRVQLYSDVVCRAFTAFGAWTFASSRMPAADLPGAPPLGWTMWVANASALVLMVYNLIALYMRIEDAHPQPPAMGASFARVGGFGRPFGISARGKLRELVDSVALAAMCAAFDVRSLDLVRAALAPLAAVSPRASGALAAALGAAVPLDGTEPPAAIYVALTPLVGVAIAATWVGILLNNDHIVHKIRTEMALTESSSKVVSTLAPQEAYLSEPRDKEPEFEVVYTIGCFDLFHAGHVKLMQRLRAHGRKLVIGIHDDESILLLKGRFPIDNTVRRLRNVKRHADVVFVIPSTDPSPYLDGVIDRSVPRDRMCYMRGSDMPQFPGRPIAEQLMHVRLFPYTEGVSSSLLRKKLLERRSSVDSDDRAAATARPRGSGAGSDDATFLRCNGEWIHTSLEPDGVAWVRSGHDYYKFVTSVNSPTIG
jgi:cytidyltransferase-like protein